MLLFVSRRGLYAENGYVFERDAVVELQRNKGRAGNVQSGCLPYCPVKGERKYPCRDAASGGTAFPTDMQQMEAITKKHGARLLDMHKYTMKY